jgi:hypothetical protein
MGNGEVLYQEGRGLGLGCLRMMSGLDLNKTVSRLPQAAHRWWWWGLTSNRGAGPGRKVRQQGTQTQH